MLHSINAQNMINSKNCTIKVDDKNITECPLCHKSIAPLPLFACVYESSASSKCASVVYFCRHCTSPFFAHYYASNVSEYSNSIIYNSAKFRYIEPVKFTKIVFDKKIIELSPLFDKIYNQALAAETSGLDEIAGLGYRKSLEFLIKDFAIHENPNDEAKIKSMPLAACIKSFMDSPNIKTLATRSAWIGNDEAHYIRKQEDRDVSDMKSFIQATVYFISMILITEDAATMEPK
ncbi:DUF4145 domain-containing protein [Roseburia sp. 831b]|uniref:DUF4145 domain-containing protein n=1 Tax=Roseburia sp. 831b TaxID=1261635 RepID=UPI000953182A|nr:DUF4145 domain-containing protein [Roseburia sp. 831b]WVK73785.1 DUF4145 domain-containing protein [Roseburia sp. 831b]